jgi:hypothetical protein
MKADKVIKKAQDDFAKLTKTPVDGVTGVAKVEEGWTVSLEAVERKGIPDTTDILALYEIHLDDEGNLLGFDRKKLRKRGDTEET